MDDIARLENLFRARVGAVRIATTEEAHALVLVREAAMGCGRRCVVWSAVGGLRDGLLERSSSIAGTESLKSACAQLGRLSEPVVTVLLDASGHMDDPPTRRAVRELIDTFAANDSTLVLIEHDAATLPVSIQSLTTPFAFALPDEEEIRKISAAIIRDAQRMQKLAVTLNREDAAALVRNLRGLDRRQVEHVVRTLIADDGELNAEDLPRLLAIKRQMVHADGLLEYVEAPVSLDELGGLQSLKAWLNKRKRALSTDASTFGLTPPRGVLLLGVQGAGKSLCAKAVATAWGRPLLRMDPGTLFDRFIGESEARLRSSLAQAEAMAPVVLWIDEIEKGFASSSSRASDGGLSQRMFGTLLTWMQEHRAPVFLVATANDIEALPPELLRKGRFDEIFFVDLPSKSAREAILAIHLSKRKRSPERFDIFRLAEVCDGYSGAEIEQGVISALHDAFSANEELTTAHVERALRGSPPLSVTMAERITELREWARGRCVSAE